MKREITLQITNDPSFLGDEATSEDLDRYTANLSELIADEFDVKALVVESSGSRSCACPDDCEIDRRLREITSGDEWLYLAFGLRALEPRPLRAQRRR